MKSAVIVFPGSNCDRDVKVAMERAGLNPVMVWHRESTLPNVDLIVLPGGFSYGDYLRSGAMAAFSPIMREVVDFGKKGGFVLGICNGFQILTEAQLLPGTLMRNRSLKFICKDVLLSVENTGTPFTCRYHEEQIVTVPVAHHDGNYFTDKDTLKSLQDNGQIMFRYVDDTGEANDNSNINGSVHNIAGVCNKEGNILGMMPHPERVTDSLTGGMDGMPLFESLAQTLN